MIDIVDILKSLSDLNPNSFDVHILDDAWHSQKALSRAIGADSSKIPPVTCVRVNLSNGVLELHPKDEKVHILCYCCFGGNPDKGIVSLEKLKETVLSLKDHYCPPFPG